MNDTTNTPGRRRKSSGLRKAIVAGVVLVAAGGGYYAWHSYKASKAKEGEYMFAQVTRGDIEDLVTATGTLEPREYVDVGAQVSGQIEDLLVEVGDTVKAGQDLVRIDAETSEAKMESTRAQLQSAENSLLSQIATLEKSKRDVERQRNLYAQDATTKQSLQDAETSYENAVRQKTNSELDIKQRKANMRIDEKNLGFTTIKAPIDGTVMTISVKKGQTVNASQQVPNVLRIANLSAMTVRADVSEADIAKVHDGIAVYFTTLNSTRRWNGVLKRTEPTPKTQQGVVLYTALFDVENEGNALRPSMTAQVFFVNASAQNVLTVPMAALQQGQQIARELAQKEREKNGAAAKGGTPNGPQGAPGAPGAPGAGGMTAAAPAAAGNSTVAANSAREGGAAPAAAAGPGSAAAAAGPTNAEGGRQGNRPNGQGNRPNNGQGGQGMRAGQGGNFNGPRPGGAGGFQNMTPEQREEMIARMRAQGGTGGQRAGGFGGQGFGQRGNNMAAAGAAGVQRPVQRRNGTVMVKKADGTLEARRIVIGVTDRVHGEVIEGLKEDEEVVVGKREAETANRPSTNNNQQNFNQNRGNAGGLGGGGFPGGGGGFPGGR